jgi:hypothetical protein
MTAEEVIREIESLEPEQRKLVHAYVLGDHTDNESVDANFRALSEQVFDEEAELFRKLAQ